MFTQLINAANDSFFSLGISLNGMESGDHSPPSLFQKTAINGEIRPRFCQKVLNFPIIIKRQVGSRTQFLFCKH